MKGLSDEEKRDLILSVGTHKSQRRLEPYEVAELIGKSLSAGATTDEISQEIALDTRTIHKFLTLLSLPQDIRLLVGWGSSSTSISFTAAAEIARLKSEEEQRVLSITYLENQLSVPEMKQVIQIRQRSNSSIEQAFEVVITQRPVIEKRHLIIGKITSEDLINHLRSMTQDNRNNLLMNALTNNGLKKPTYGAKLDQEFFYLFGDTEDHRSIMRLLPGFEAAISNYLLIVLNRQ